MNKEKIEKALLFLLKKQEKDLNNFYNSVEIANILNNLTKENDVIVAGLLRSYIINPKSNLEEVESKFGKRIMELVLRNIDICPNNSFNWREINTERIKYLKTQTYEEKIIIFATTLVNLRKFSYKYEIEGDSIFEKHHYDKLDLFWYLSSIIEQCSELKYSPYYFEYKELMRTLAISKTMVKVKKK